MSIMNASLVSDSIKNLVGTDTKLKGFARKSFASTFCFKGFLRAKCLASYLWDSMPKCVDINGKNYTLFNHQMKVYELTDLVVFG